ncbi:uncharacterized protein APUU_50596A [Aspergillus puulaauensis]|uniref:Myb-like domain-containing protein n=1 Tax=Aspergillus puulaauensis TaxID=1220207 RepID=A0A7R8AQS0_9EURO|nr:uncharacterized protein APUU_50596A [Aspergillus puulaauensis]BCS25885.1 hypothetical protein APUU_50596A [Aspergillus puulaauensis]
MVMDERPIAELKKRWIDIQDDKHKAREVRKVYGLDEVDGDWYFDEEYDKERHVSFSSSTDEDEDEDEDMEEDDSLSRRPKTKRIYYIDNEFTLDEVLLLHQIAADWKKDRWKTISSRFNEKTGRDITPGQAKSVIDD